jgi:hypothetical protein
MASIPLSRCSETSSSLEKLSTRNSEDTYKFWSRNNFLLRILQAFSRVFYPIKRPSLPTSRFPSSRELDLLPLSKYSYDLILIYRSRLNLQVEYKRAASSIAKKLSLRTERASLSDFNRFKVMVERKNRSSKLRQLAKEMLVESKSPFGRLLLARKVSVV